MVQAFVFLLPESIENTDETHASMLSIGWKAGAPDYVLGDWALVRDLKSGIQVALYGSEFTAGICLFRKSYGMDAFRFNLRRPKTAAAHQNHVFCPVALPCSARVFVELPKNIVLPGAVELAEICETVRSVMIGGNGWEIM